MTNKIIQKLKSAFENKNYALAATYSNELYQQDRSNINAIKNHALMLLLTDDFENSLKLYIEVFNKNNTDADVNINLALLFEKFEEYEKSLLHCNLAKELDSTNPYVYKTESKINFKLKKFQNAIELLKIGSKIAEGNKNHIRFFEDLNHRLINLYASINDLNNLNHIIKIELNKNIIYPTIFYHLCKMHSSFINENVIKRIHQQTKKKAQSKIELFDLAHIYNGLGNYYGQKDTEMSEKYFIQSQNAIHQANNYKSESYVEQKEVENIIYSINQFPNNYKTNKNLGEGVIFILGFPRSGTTLTESIVANSENVFAGDEIQSFNQLSKKYLIIEKNSKIKNDLHNHADRVAATYLRRINFLKGEKKFITDKLPGNQCYLFYISQILPNSKIIYIKRNLWDNAISMFKEPYIGKLSWTSQFFNLGVTMASYQFLVDYQLKFMKKEQFLQINYEDLVSNPEETSNKLYTFCDIDHILDPEKRKKFVSRTASHDQVKRDIFKSSVDKSSQFKGFKEEFENAYNTQMQILLSKNIH